MVISIIMWAFIGFIVTTAARFSFSYLAFHAAKPTKPIIAKNSVHQSYGMIHERAEQFSYIGWQVVKAFEALPENVRPLYDIEAAIKALDFKYEGRKRVDEHFPYSAVRGGTNSTWNCYCTTGRMRHDTCQDYPEYVAIANEIRAIEAEQQRQQWALEAQERAVQLAGMQNDIDSVESIMQALKSEREAINSVTADINKQTLSLSKD